MYTSTGACVTRSIPPPAHHLFKWQQLLYVLLSLLCLREHTQLIAGEEPIEPRFPVYVSYIAEGCSYDLDRARDLLWSDIAFGSDSPMLIEFGDSDFTELSDTRCPGTPALNVDMSAKVFTPFTPSYNPRRAFPLVLIVHGQQSDWDVPGFEGYDYLAYGLTRQGYVVASLDFRSMLDSTIKSRGELIREHLRRFVQRNARGSGSYLEGKLDLSSVVLIGHSRGGDAITAAWEWQRVSPDAGYSIAALVAIAPVQFFGVVDEEPHITTHLRDVAYQIIQGSKDGDVSDFQGLRTYDRSSDPDEAGDSLKSMVFIRNANHNFFNSVWEEEAGDDFCCEGVLDGETQRALAMSYIYAFLEAALYGEPGHLALLEDAALNPIEETEVALDLQLPSQDVLQLDHYQLNQLGGSNTTLSSSGGSSEVQPLDAQSLWIERQLSTGTLPPWNSYVGDTGAASVSWKGDLQYLSWLSSTVRQQQNPSIYPTLSFRIAEVARNALQTEDTQHLLREVSIRLIDQEGQISEPLSLMEQLVLTLDWQGINGGPKTVMTHARIPLSDFSGVDVSRLAGIELSLSLAWEGQVVLDELRLTP